MRPHQNLYEKKLVTYPRTDARVLSTAVAKEISKNLNGLMRGYKDEEVQNLLKKEYISSRDEIVNKKIRVYYHIEPIGKEYLEQTTIEFRKKMHGVLDIIAYGEGKKDE